MLEINHIDTKRLIKHDFFRIFEEHKDKADN